MKAYTHEQIAGCLESRLTWYKKSVDMASGVIPWENGFDWPEFPLNSKNKADKGLIQKWRGAIAELQNTLAMLKHGK